MIYTNIDGTSDCQNEVKREAIYLTAEEMRVVQTALRRHDPYPEAEYERENATVIAQWHKEELEMKAIFWEGERKREYKQKERRYVREGMAYIILTSIMAILFIYL